MFKKLARWALTKLSPPKVDKRCGPMWMKKRFEKWSKDEIVDIYIEMAMKPDERSWFSQYLVEERELKRTRQILKSKYYTEKDLNRALHVSDLEEKVKRLKKEVRDMQVYAENHNRTAYATGLIVNCTGCDAGEPLNGGELTEDRVKEVEVLASRLRTWFDNHKYRLERLQ